MHLLGQPEGSHWRVVHGSEKDQIGVRRESEWRALCGHLPSGRGSPTIIGGHKNVCARIKYAPEVIRRDVRCVVP